MASDLPEWKLYSLELDDSGKEIGNFFESKGYPLKRAVLHPKTKCQLINDPVLPEKVEAIIKEAVPEKGRVLALSSHGSYHHLTYGLCKRADKLSTEYGYIHIDRHNDMFGMVMDKRIPEIHCGMFVGKICENTNVGKRKFRPDVFFVGSCVPLLEGLLSPQAIHYAFTGTKDSALSDLLCSFDRHLDRLPEDVYISIDLDVLAPSEVRTAWDRGSMTAGRLYELVEKIKSRKAIISADIIGYTTDDTPFSAYDGEYDILTSDIRDAEEPSFERSMKVYTTLVDIIRRN
ncbi:MAG: arginase family protein [Candidatus Nanoarchaeia archaeon]|nr:arginase family protein [Candidatus Nanoarchaeia archaeon]